MASKDKRPSATLSILYRSHQVCISTLLQLSILGKVSADMFKRLLYGLPLAYWCGFVVTQGVVVDHQPIEIVCDGSIISTTTRYEIS